MESADYSLQRCLNSIFSTLLATAQFSKLNRSYYQYNKKKCSFSLYLIAWSILFCADAHKPKVHRDRKTNASKNWLKPKENSSCADEMHVVEQMAEYRFTQQYFPSTLFLFLLFNVYHFVMNAICFCTQIPCDTIVISLAMFSFTCILQWYSPMCVWVCDSFVLSIEEEMPQIKEKLKQTH